MITIQAGYALVIDDEPANREFVERLLQTASFKVQSAATGEEGLRAARAIPQLALALVDQQLPDATGLEIIAKLRSENPEALLVMATMHDDNKLIEEAFEQGIDVFLVKPHGFMELYRRLQDFDADTSVLRQVIIDQYGPRPYRGARGKKPASGSIVTPAAVSDSAAPSATTTAAPAPVAAPTKSEPPATTPSTPASVPSQSAPQVQSPVPQPAQPNLPAPSSAPAASEEPQAAGSPHTDVTLPRKPKDWNLTPNNQ